MRKKDKGGTHRREESHIQTQIKHVPFLTYMKFFISFHLYILFLASCFLSLIIFFRFPPFASSLSFYRISLSLRVLL